MRNENFREFAKYASLNTLGMVGLSLYILADTFFISKGLGANGLTALNLALPIYNLVHGAGLMLGMGGATRYSIVVSRGDRERGNEAFTATMMLMAAFSLVFMALGLFFFRGQITTLLGADPEVYEMTRTYLKVILLFSPAFISNEIFLGFVRNDGNPRLATICMLMGSLFNIVFDYIFIFPLGDGNLRRGACHRHLPGGQYLADHDFLLWAWKTGIPLPPRDTGRKDFRTDFLSWGAVSDHGSLHRSGHSGV